MPADKKFCVIIPAKEVSKRIPGKNLKMLAGKPMLAYIIEAAKNAKGVDRVVVSTESEKVKKIAEQYGAEVPFMRPRELTEDHITTQQVIDHVLEQLEQKERYVPDYIIILYATSPLLKTKRIEEAIQIALRRDSECVISGYFDKGEFWIEEEGGWARLYPRKLVNSQFRDPLFRENGAVTVAKTHTAKYRRGVMKADILVMEPEESIDVDYPEDFARVEKIINERHVKREE